MKPQDDEMLPPLRSWDRGKEGYYLASHGVFGPEWIAVKIDYLHWDAVFDAGGPDNYSVKRYGQPGVIARGQGAADPHERGHLPGFGSWHFVRRDIYDRLRPEWLTHVRRVPCRP
jgi:hypothetical protein